MLRLTFPLKCLRCQTDDFVWQQHHHDQIHSQMSSFVKLSWSWSKLFKLCIPPFVRIHTNHKSLTERHQWMESHVRQANEDLSFTLTTGAHVRKRCFPRWWVSAAQGRKSSPGGWPWQGPPSYYCNVCPGCCRTVVGWSLCLVHPFWAQTCPRYGGHPWAPCFPC